MAAETLVTADCVLKLNTMSVCKQEVDAVVNMVDIK
jgi:hypothetical protein